MHVISVPQSDPGDRALPPRPVSYSVLSFGSRSAAVKYCLELSDALGQRDGVAGGGSCAEATLWLAAAPVPDGSCNVFACDRALAAARTAGLDAPVSGRVPADAMPSARCLVVGSSQDLVSS